MVTKHTNYLNLSNTKTQKRFIKTSLLLVTLIAAVVIIGLRTDSISSKALTSVYSDYTSADDFERPKLGKNWSINFGNVGIVHRSDLGLLSSSGMGLVTWEKLSFGPDQFSEIILPLDISPNMMVQPFVRRSGNDQAPRYGFGWDDEALRWYFKYDGGPQTRILATNTSYSTPVPGDTVRIEVSGTHPVALKGFHNGTLVLEATDAEYNRILDGRPGIAYRLKLGTGATYPAPAVEIWRGGRILIP